MLTFFITCYFQFHILFVLDIDECLLEESCHISARCTNTAGSYYCTCLPGYMGDGKNSCEGKNKCFRNVFYSVVSYVNMIEGCAKLKTCIVVSTTFPIKLNGVAFYGGSRKI